MSSFRRVLIVLAVCAIGPLVACGSQPSIDEDFPPGNPVLGDEPRGDNPVLGSQGDGLGEDDSTDYVLLAILAVCLIVAGTLLVRVERWERRRAAGSTEGS